MVAESFKFMVLRVVENALVSEKIESAHFYSCSQAKIPLRFLTSLLQAELGYPFLQNNRFFENLFFPSRKGGDLRS